MRRHLMTTYFVFKVIALHRVLVLQLLLLLQFMTVIVSMASRHFIVSCLIISYLILFYSYSYSNLTDEDHFLACLSFIIAVQLVLLTRPVLYGTVRYLR